MHKIATCCYCGARAALVLRGRERHELACSSCGAPLHNLKMLKAENTGKPNLVKQSAQKPKPDRRTKPEYAKRRKPKRKRRTGFAMWLLKEAWDEIEDIFD